MDSALNPAQRDAAQQRRLRRLRLLDILTEIAPWLSVVQREVLVWHLEQNRPEPADYLAWATSRTDGLRSRN